VKFKLNIRLVLLIVINFFRIKNCIFKKKGENDYNEINNIITNNEELNKNEVNEVNK
jgi:hypothetical protein